MQTFKGATIVHFPTLVIEGDFYPLDLKSLYAVFDILACKGVSKRKGVQKKRKKKKVK